MQMLKPTFMVAGNYFGNCGYSVGGSNSSLIYRPCLPENSMCGLLQCNSSNKDAVLKLHSYYYYHGRVSLDGQAYPCSTILYDVGRQIVKVISVRISPIVLVITLHSISSSEYELSKHKCHLQHKLGYTLSYYSMMFLFFSLLWA